MSNPSTSTNYRNVLVTNVGPVVYDRFADVLRRTQLDVDRVPRASSALELIEVVPFDVLIIGYPLEDPNLDTVLKKIRATDSPCRRSSVLILSAPGSEENAQRYLGKGVNRVFAQESDAEVLESEVSSLLMVAPRVSMRIITHIDVKIEGTSRKILCQTENLSASGMLVRTNRNLGIGSRLHFSFSLPNEKRPIVGVGEVVRQTQGGRENATGVGIRFEHLTGESTDRVTAYLASLNPKE